MAFSLMESRRRILLNTPHVESASGDIASFSTDMHSPLRSLRIGIDPVQSGTGDPSPDNVRPISGWSAVNVWRTGKNLIEISSNTIYTNAIGSTYLANGVRVYTTVSGAYKSNTWRTISLDKFRGEALTFSCTSDGNNKRVLARFKDKDGGNIGPALFEDTAASVSHVVTVLNNFPDGAFLAVNFYATGSVSTTATATYTDIMLNLGSTALPYEPYTGNQYTIQLGQTVYGGTLDVTNGVLTVDRAYALLNDPDKWVAASSTTQDFEYTKRFNDRKLYSTSFQGLICSAFAVDISAAVYMRWTSSTSKKIGIKNNTSAYTLSDIQQMAQGNQIAIVYELATPITIPLTPQQISTLKGVNNIWADCGPVSSKYWTHK